MGSRNLESEATLGSEIPGRLQIQHQTSNKI